MSQALSPLRILIAATPKTGNMWLKALLAQAYNLPIVEFPPAFDAKALDALGHRWVSHQHIDPSPELLNWAASNDVIVVTLLRHPGDVLISLKHFVSWFDDPRQPDPAARDLSRDGSAYGARTQQFVETNFPWHLNTSYGWLRAGAHVVRYEELISSPVVTLTALTERILPVGRERIEAAVAMCRLDRIRSSGIADSRHFRRGEIGCWQRELPAELISFLQNSAYYKHICAEFGYSFSEPASQELPPFDYSRLDPFGARTQFDNGIPIPNILTHLYLATIPRAKERWPEPWRVSDSNNFFDWLMQPAEGDDERIGGTSVRPTNFAYYVWMLRSDLREFFPTLKAEGLGAYCRWFVSYGRAEYQLPYTLVEPMHLVHLRQLDVDCAARPASLHQQPQEVPAPTAERGALRVVGAA